MSIENPLAAIPTDQLVHQLVQELARRVEKLEKKNEAKKEQNPAERESQAGCSTDNGIKITSDQPNTVRYSSQGSRAEDEDDRSCCPTCTRVLGSSCRCVEVPYGYLLDDEAPSEGMESIERRANALNLTDERLFRLLKKSGTAGVPADGRLNFKNFWSSGGSYNLEVAIEAVRELDRHQGYLSVRDFDPDGHFITYRIGNPIFGCVGTTLEDETSGNICAPPIRFDSQIGVLAPYNRLIVLAGLSTIMTKSTDNNPFFESSYFDRLDVQEHLRPEKSEYGSTKHLDNPRTINTHFFHFTWYEVSTRQQFSSSWKMGSLHKKVSLSLCEVANTFQAISYDRSKFWTILVLLPPDGFKSQIDEWEFKAIASKNFPLLVLMARLCILALRSAWVGWYTLVQYIDGLLGTGSEIFDLEAHDNLIFEDDLYTRSKRYFWVINCLNESEKVITRNTQVWVGYRDNVLFPFGQTLLKEGDAEMSKELDGAIQECNERQVDLENIKKEFNEQRTKAIALRDGLFSASAVMESRASTRLGENVKLLTYVSIFYLPLAFCTSIWSTTDTFGYHNLAYTMVAVGLLTYLIVFNLNLLVSFSKSSYSSFKKCILSSMQADSRKSWKKKGVLFHEYRPRESAERSKPSEWWILVYLLQRCLDVVLFRKREKREDANAENEVA
ncbi:uncharacterized protein K444DRAFT_576582 [Hyaloscypha bicolor E]|uniref:Uncharacterized protein n=1 Tax=Hyaloscypha bicolor E TaxID=1095630 RepID=A0A2J6SJA4_9HELO|nr:uncharacterized protein K444DRAFT_576582 [Hyaloscypha bicolor E]PMD50854.1 hypothetical protein K444DRAFT_576582 [Hyaloscypha bicolor E]